MVKSKEPRRNVYVGHRYVPLIMGQWDKSIAYEGLSIVQHEGNSYTSRKHVPIGVDILNEEFWAVTGNYNVQVEQYRQEVIKLLEDVDLLELDLSKKVDQTVFNSKVSELNTLISRKADQSTMTTELNKKADKTEMKEALNTKPDLIEKTTVYMIPDDYPTLNHAIQDLYHKHTMGTKIELRIKSGHRPILRVYMKDAFLPNVVLTSEDDLVKIGDDLESGRNLIELTNVTGFTLGCLIDMEGKGDHGLNVQGGSTIRIETGCGVINAGGDGLHVRHGSRAYAQFTRFTGAGKGASGGVERAGISAWGGTVNAHGADVSGSAHHGARSAHGGVLDIDNGKANNCGFHGIRSAQGGRVTCGDAEAKNCGIHGIYALNNSIINADRTNVTGAKSVGYNAVGASIIHANEGIADECGVGVRAGRASTINFLGGSALNCKDAGIIAEHSSTVQARNCTIQGKQLRGVHVIENSNCNIQNSLIYGSRIYGLHVNQASTVNANVTIIRNTQPDNHNSHGVVCESLSRVSLSSSQVWNNGGDDLRVDSGGQINARQCLTSSGVRQGEDNIKTPQVEDINLSAFNTINRAGIIFN